MLRETNHYFNDDELLANSVEKLAVNSNDPYLLMTLISRTRRELCFKGLQVGGRGKGEGEREDASRHPRSCPPMWHEDLKTVYCCGCTVMYCPVPGAQLEPEADAQAGGASGGPRHCHLPGINIYYCGGLQLIHAKPLR